MPESVGFRTQDGVYIPSTYEGGSRTMEIARDEYIALRTIFDAIEQHDQVEKLSRATQRALTHYRDEWYFGGQHDERK